jgi:hypothetical protein
VKSKKPKKFTKEGTKVDASSFYASFCFFGFIGFVVKEQG